MPKDSEGVNWHEMTVGPVALAVALRIPRGGGRFFGWGLLVGALIGFALGAGAAVLVGHYLLTSR